MECSHDRNPRLNSRYLIQSDFIFFLCVFARLLQSFESLRLLVSDVLLLKLHAIHRQNKVAPSKHLYQTLSYLPSVNIKTINRILFALDTIL